LNIAEALFFNTLYTQSESGLAGSVIKAGIWAEGRSLVSLDDAFVEGGVGAF